jgi:1-acyl-sn-glycerol-3-phosphate acyltransferase
MLLYRLLVAIGPPLARLVFRPCVTGTESVPRTGGYVVCPNHLSGFDVLAVAFAIGLTPLRSMAKNQLFRRPLLGPFVRSLGAFPARPEGDLRGGIDEAAALAQGGAGILIFPEGARRYGRVRRPRTGAARTALAAGVPLVPVAIRGTDGWRRVRRWQVAFGPPVPLDDLAGVPAHDAAREATSRLWDRVTALEAELAR